MDDRSSMTIAFSSCDHIVMMFFAITISIDVVDRNDRTHRSMAIDCVDPVASESISNKNAFDTFGLGKSDNAVCLSLQKSHANLLELHTTETMSGI